LEQYCSKSDPFINYYYNNKAGAIFGPRCNCIFEHLWCRCTFTL